MTDDRRISDDPTRREITQISVNVAELGQLMRDHIKWSEDITEKRDVEIKGIVDRLKPIEDMHETLKTAVKIGAVIGTPAALGIGAGLWSWIKKVSSHLP